jgi:hypothetical protein
MNEFLAEIAATAGCISVALALTAFRMKPEVAVVVCGPAFLLLFWLVLL